MIIEAQKQPLVFFVLGNYCSYNEVSFCIKEIYKIKYSNYKILVVDDGSPDDSLLKLQKEFSSVYFIKTKLNRGYCSTFNIGCEKAFEEGAIYVFWTQNDSKNFTPNIINAIVKTFDNDKSLGLVGTKILDNEGNIRWDSQLIERLGIKYNISEGFAISKKAFYQTKGMDEKLVVYFEDIDLISRARRLGFTSTVIDDESWVHIGGQTYSKLLYKKNYYRVRNKFIILGRYTPKKSLFWFIRIILGESKQHVILCITLLLRLQIIKSVTVLLALIFGTISGSYLFVIEKLNHRKYEINSISLN